MTYLLQFEFQKGKQSVYWLPIFLEADSIEKANEIEKSIYIRLNNSFDKVLKHSTEEYSKDIVSNNLVKDYIEEERKGEFTILNVNAELEINEVDSNANKDVEFDKDFTLTEYDKGVISYLDFGKKKILTRKLSDNIDNFNEYLLIKLKRKAGIIRMEPKKNPKADLEKLRGTFTLAGLVLSLFIVYAMVNWKFYDVQAAELGQLVVEEEEEDIIPITEQNTPPPPPPPPPAAPEVIEIVEDEVEVEDIEIDTEIDVDEVVEVFEEEEEIVEEEVFTIVESMPEFPGGQKKLFEYLNKSVKFPPAAKANGISGKVYVNFTIGKDGEIRDIKVLRGVHDLLDKEAVRVVKAMPKWKAGKQRGKAVSVSYNLPINFVLR
ncbi:MAG: energy transducer TonB [Vicingaceae bacterium]